ncbi:MAG: Ig-like domain-containing protein, partial [Gemmatimonadaceae bacterium]
MLRRIFSAVGVSLVIAGCGGANSDHLVAPPPAPVLTTLSVALTASTVYVGSGVVASATGVDQNGDSIATGALTWSTGTPSVASVENDGQVTAVAPGTTSIIATAGAVQAQLTLTVKQQPVARMKMLPATARVIRGGTQQLTVRVLDPNGNQLAGRAVTWTSSDTSKATVSSTGLVTGVATGGLTITATSEMQSDSAAITVMTPPHPGTAPAILSIAPAVLTPGATITITGTGFSTAPAADTLTIDSVAAVVTAASATQLTATVPMLPCTPTHAAAIQVTVGEFWATATQTLQTATPETLPVGGSAVITAAGALACMELPLASGDYVVSVFSDLQ